MLRTKEKMSMILVIALLCCLSLGALAEGTLMTIQAMKRVKAFSEDSILQEDLDLIMEAGVSTVYQMERQNWQFVAITDTTVLNDIAEDIQVAFDSEESSDDSLLGELKEQVEALTDSYSNEPAINEAPAAIVIYADEAAGLIDTDFDCGIAAQNMMMTANALGYGTSVINAPIGVLNGTDHDAYCMQFGVDADMNAVAVLLLGIPEESSTEEYNIEELMIEKVSYVQ